MVFTLAFLTRPRPGLAEQDFFEHYTQVHRPLAEQLPELVSYRQTRVSKSGYRGGEAVNYAAFSEYTFPNEDAAERSWASPEAKALDADAALFMDGPTVLTIPLTELGTFVTDPAS